MRNLTCINCPIGCSLKVYGDREDNIRVTGNKCGRGLKYGIDEILHPKRIVTSSIVYNGNPELGTFEMLPVKTSESIPKELIFNVLEEIKKCRVKGPYNIGDVIISDVCGTGVDIIVTKKTT